MSFLYPKVLFHVGNPLLSEPHRDISQLQKFARRKPDYAIVVVVEKEEDEALLKKELEKFQLPEFHPGGFITLWKNDEDMLDTICGDLHAVQTWAVVGIGWYECEKGHRCQSDDNEFVEKCKTPGCDLPVEYLKQNEEQAERFKQIVHRAVNLMNFDTRSGAVLNTTTNPTGNVLRNMLHLPNPLPIQLEDYVGLGKGKVAFCVASGPSLKRQVEHIKRLQGPDAIIITAGRNYKMLSAMGVNVDFTFSCEMYGWDAVIFDNLTRDEIKTSVLCFPPVCAPETVEKWKGKKLCAWDVNTAELLGKKTWLMGGNSIAHHMYNFAAQILGCERIILCGQDLAYTEPTNETHAEGTFHAFPEAVNKEDRNFQTEDWAPCTDQKAGPFYPTLHKNNAAMMAGAITPVGPVLVRTSPSYKNFGSLFEIIIRRHGKKTWNACPNGLKITGAPYLDLSSLTSLKDVPA